MPYRYHIATVDIPGHHQAIELDHKIRWVIEQKSIPAAGMHTLTVLLEEPVSEPAEPRQ